MSVQKTLTALLITLILGGYAFTAGAYIFTWSVYKDLTNHYETRLKSAERKIERLEAPWGDLDAPERRERRERTDPAP